ncbi:MAG: hydroxyisourate hydrolase [Proteobacteria bacterium]|nr:MAG: hydroxyisourate hydrolase [Pseudomonadota bacterium]
MSQITTHILDTARGCPAEGVRVVFYRVEGARFVELAHGVTDDDGRVSGLLEEGVTLDEGTYRMLFEVSGYFRNRGHKHFYPYVDVVFNVDGDGQHYHIPLLLSPYGYSTYRGS